MGFSKNTARIFLGLQPFILAFGNWVSLPYARATVSRGGSIEKPIYGQDDRKDIYEVSSPEMLKWADASVALFSTEDVAVDPARKVATLKTLSYADELELCPEEKFYDQVIGAFCSGVLVGPDLILTAGHCITSEAACQRTQFVFGFAVRKAGEMPKSIPANDVYGCDKLIARHQEADGADYALVKLDRNVSDHVPLKVQRKKRIKKKTNLVVIGHPSGLPTKIAAGGTIRRTYNGFLGFGKRHYFLANLDTYAGNSGSPVINQQTGVVEGLLVRGHTDYEYRDIQNCRVSVKCAENGCSGEQVSKLSGIVKRIPK